METPTFEIVKATYCNSILRKLKTNGEVIGE
jgi:hypothetical protein